MVHPPTDAHGDAMHPYTSKERPRENGHRRESMVFYITLVTFEIFLLIIYALWIDYKYPGAAVSVGNMYNIGVRDVAIMVFVGFGFLMTFLRRHAYSALGYTFLISCVVIQWSIPCFGVAEFLHKGHHITEHSYDINMEALLNALFCAAAVMISFGAILGRATPLQLLIMAIIEPVLFFVNFYVGYFVLQAFDAGGGMFLHLFGAVYGLAIARFLTNKDTLRNKDNLPSYTGDVTAMIGTLFLWIMWPSFNAAPVPVGNPQLRAIINTFIALTGSTVASFLVSRIFAHHRFDMVHVQNSTLSGGVAMGVAAHIDISIAGAFGTGLFTGAVSVLGYHFLTPFLARRFSLQDTCGIINLHGIPGLISSLAGVFAALRAINDPSKYEPAEFAILFLAGDDQAKRQAAATFISIGIPLVGGILTGILLKYVGRLNDIGPNDWFNDRMFWEIPSDYYQVVDKVVDSEGREMEMVNGSQRRGEGDRGEGNREVAEGVENDRIPHTYADAV
eukprot:TRINITY_DN245_c0_g2_i1.p1 TRINITY_DN245_c0_g2~~TRINITY_DN245_c0_g2_i1.p1  ORF type:complete len:504 (+),score=76.29 TRINITY_DN245_c0_g2_i1:180-1691(+)